MKSVVVLRTLFIISVISIILSSCTQDEGFGGDCIVRGKLVEKIYNDDYSLLLKQQAAKDENVFLLFGNATSVGERNRTGYTGDFEFNYLWPGNYKIYYFSEEAGTELTGSKEIVIEFFLSKGEILDLGELMVLKTVSFDDGNSSISGRVILTNYKNDSKWPNLIVKDVSPAQEHEVYLVYGNHEQYDKRIRTNYDGTFTFSNLINGDYLIYVYSEDVRGGTEKVVVKANVSITKENQTIALDDFNIEKL